jgi:hypothetical protein
MENHKLWIVNMYDLHDKHLLSIILNSICPIKPICELNKKIFIVQSLKNIIYICTLKIVLQLKK